MKIFAFAALVASQLVTSGCQHARGYFALASSEFNTDHYKTVFEERVWGEQCTNVAALATDSSGAKNVYRQAVRNALDKAPGANALTMVDVTLSYGGCARVEGLPVILR